MANGNGHNVGYVRVSSFGQNLDRQLDGIELDKVFTEKASAKDAKRPKLQECIQYLRDGDILHVHSICRLARNLIDLQTIINELNSKDTVGFVAEDGGRAVGFVTGGYERHGDEIYGGEIYTLYVLKNFQCKGIGTELVSALAGQFNRLAIYSMLVRVLKLNPYRRFYKKRNGILLKSEHQPFETEVLDVEVYGWLDATLIAG